MGTLSLDGSGGGGWRSWSHVDCFWEGRPLARVKTPLCVARVRVITRWLSTARYNPSLGLAVLSRDTRLDSGWMRLALQFQPSCFYLLFCLHHLRPTISCGPLPRAQALAVVGAALECCGWDGLWFSHLAGPPASWGVLVEFSSM